MKIGLFGGSFDPVHVGHLLLAEQCLEAVSLDRILFIPASIPPHKLKATLGTPQDRQTMLQLAIGGHEKFEVDTFELDRQEVSYTVDTLQHMTGQFADDELFLLMGADSLDEFHTWKDPATICHLATPVVVERPGASPVNYEKLEPFADPETIERAKGVSFQSRQIEISSTEIRERVRQHKSIRYLVPRAVEQFILEKGIYRD